MGIKRSSARNIVPGINPVLLALHKDPSNILEIWVAEGSQSQRLSQIILEAKEKNINLTLKKRQDLDHITEARHQGVIAFLKEYHYADLDTVLANSMDSSKYPTILALDHITDEGNLGGIVRTSAFFKVEGIILPKDRSARVGPTVFKRSAGACTMVPICLVNNLKTELWRLKEKGFWIIGTSSHARTSLYQFDFLRPMVIIIGNEQKGMSPSLKRICDDVISIPGEQLIDSLNVSVATGIILSEIRRQKLGEK